jgi:hypothetical protein
MNAIRNELLSASMNWNSRTGLTDSDLRASQKASAAFSTDPAPCAACGSRAQSAQLLALTGREAIAASTNIEIGLAQPIAKRLVRDAQIAAQLANALLPVRISSTASARNSGA